MPNAWVASDSVQVHDRRTCAALVARDAAVEVIDAGSRRARMFDPCPLCVPGALLRRRAALVIDLAAAERQSDSVTS
jgi:hypothetical protein